MMFFFFSSRRRHTRCSRDWSSDVCSSDLERLAERAELLAGVRLRVGIEGRGAVGRLERLPQQALELGQIRGAEREADVARRDHPLAREDADTERQPLVVARALWRAVLGGGPFALDHLEAQIGMPQAGEAPRRVAPTRFPPGLPPVDPLDGDWRSHAPALRTARPRRALPPRRRPTPP